MEPPLTPKLSVPTPLTSDATGHNSQSMRVLYLRITGLITSALTATRPWAVARKALYYLIKLGLIIWCPFLYLLLSLLHLKGQHNTLGILTGGNLSMIEQPIIKIKFIIYSISYCEKFSSESENMRGEVSRVWTGKYGVWKNNSWVWPTDPGFIIAKVRLGFRSSLRIDNFLSLKTQVQEQGSIPGPDYLRAAKPKD
ncbi:hypothetical protein DSO57_1031278 [Entomophthora muscae]|uniref:Uncharacterized protein n=1 Tax=Entomophthora muscae TaxID=34485 RepID=A0ACC2RFC7_9FUNG|nr:hypothetical protein DSO57_1031278 [Entomophthora muscae]